MQNFDQLLDEQGFQNRFHEFQNLMRFRIREVLLVSSLYDSFILEEDGQLYEKIHSEFHDMNLSQAPGITRVSSGSDALRVLQEGNRYDLVITSLNLGDMDAMEFARKVKESGRDIPVVLLTYEHRELNELIARYDTSDFEKVFIWQGDFRILLAIIKYVEDKKNVFDDMRCVGVQSIIVIEDNVHYYSSFLPIIYTEILRHSHNLISEGINVAHKLLRMRARPKILLCDSYEEAWEYYSACENCVLGVISDIEFPRGGKSDPEAGVHFARAVKASHFDIPVLLQSDSAGMAELAEELGASFLLKSSPVLLQDLNRFIHDNFGFGDFVFLLPNGTEVARAGNLRSLEERLETIPRESILFHAERNHFSNWLKSRTEFWLAHKLRPQKVSDFESADMIRRHLIDSLRDYRRRQSRGIVADFNPRTFDPTSSFARVGGGSLGGKARGLAFTRTILKNFSMRNRFEGVILSVPSALVLGTDVFDQFLDENGLRDMAIRNEDEEEIVSRFVEAPFPEEYARVLASYLDLARYPLAVRSSSLLEDSRYLPFAGIYLTCMLPNSGDDAAVRLEALINAVKRVFASTFSRSAKAYIHSTHYRLEEEKMAVIIQKLVGGRHETRFYPDFAGVARSHNFYPRPPIMAKDGIASVGLGLGRMVIDGGETIRFCPSYPTHDIQFSDMKDLLRYTQKKFYALDLDMGAVSARAVGEDDLAQFDLDVAGRDGTLAGVGSTYSAGDDRISVGLSRKGVPLVTFAPILKSHSFALPEILRLLLDLGEWGMSSPVEIEFAARLTTPAGTPKEFGVLQVRPLVKSHELIELDVDDVEPEKVLCMSPQVLGNGVIDDIRDIVMVDPEKFDRAKSLDVAAEVDRFNADLLAAERPYLLIGMGRWGSSDSWLGIPVTWAQISGVRVIIETGFKDFKVVPSQGTHFFQNLSSFHIGYFTVNAYSNEGAVDWKWLADQEAVAEQRYTRHIRFDDPLVVRMNGHSNRGVIVKP
jgi:CheY-like chemotaxis protein